LLRVRETQMNNEILAAAAAAFFGNERTFRPSVFAFIETLKMF